jgi:hypothetical protein
MSYANTTTITPTNSSDANFRAWGLQINTKLALMGLVQTADSGQINWTTVLAPVAGSTVKGYEIWRFADTLQSTVPVYFKFEYGSGSATNDPSIHHSIGSGSDGAGTLTGIVGTRQQLTFTATAGAINAYYSGDTNRFAFCFVGAGATTSIYMSWERTIDTSGNVTNEGVLMSTFKGGAGQSRAWNCLTGPYTPWETSWGTIGGQQAPFGTTGTQVAVYPVLHNKGVFLQYGLGSFAYVDATIAAGSTITFSVYGANHTFMPMGGTCFNGALTRTTATTALMMRYE